MNALWLLLALWIGFFAGFFVFALLAMARDRESREPARYLPLRAKSAPHWTQAPIGIEL